MTTLKDPAGSKATIEEPVSLMAWGPKSEMPEDVEPDPLFVALVFRLPKRGSLWPAKDRESWTRMFNTIADAIHPESKADEARDEPHGSRPRKYVQLGKIDYSDPRDAAEMVIEAIQRAGKPAHVWYNDGTGRVRICGDDYNGEDDEVLVGVYDSSARAGNITRDIKETRKRIHAAT